ncbi:hypothetical protein GCM10008106_12260 [Mongoliitalea lutea]|uniref:Uncharacterized protein n=1 Tax=Mongoliitalea lutea TaxID=849756 RepID=A0A8J3CWT3_9BACT|nr:hypothetical protein GCM10008106_12260 [Mongoliitalea lutea]
MIKKNKEKLKSGMVKIGVIYLELFVYLSMKSKRRGVRKTPGKYSNLNIKIKTSSEIAISSKP